MKYEMNDVMKEVYETRVTLEALISELVKAGVIKPDKENEVKK